MSSDPLPFVTELDIEVKKKQLEKLTLEINQANSIGYKVLDICQKALVPVIAMAYGLYTVLGYSDKIEAAKKVTIELEVKQIELSEKQKQIKLSDEKIAKSEAKFEDQSKKSKESIIQLVQVIAELNEKKSKLDLDNANIAIAKTNEITKGSSLFLDRVYIQFMGAMTREKINALRSELNSEGFITPDAERISHKTGNRVKYFIDTPQERLRAEQVMEKTRLFFAKQGCSIQDLKIQEPNKNPAPKPSPIELWLEHKCT